MVCVLHLEHISICTKHISCAQGSYVHWHTWHAAAVLEILGIVTTTQNVTIVASGRKNFSGDGGTREN